MKLQLNTARAVDDLNEKSIEEALSSLTDDAFLDSQDTHYKIAGSFAILHKSEDHYIKADRTGPDRFALQYSDGSDESVSWYNCVDDNLELSAILRAFQLYLNGDDRWRTEFEWQPVDNPFNSKTSGCLVFIAVLAFLFTVMVCRVEW